MSDMVFTATHLAGGVWQGMLLINGNVASPPEIIATHQGQAIDGISLTPDPASGAWLLSVPIPAAAICDGVNSIIISDPKTGADLYSFSILAGDLQADDLRAEVNLLRDELDLLKKAFRKHCTESK